MYLTFFILGLTKTEFPLLGICKVILSLIYFYRICIANVYCSNAFKQSNTHSLTQKLGKNK